MTMIHPETAQATPAEPRLITHPLWCVAVNDDRDFLQRPAHLAHLLAAHDDDQHVGPALHVNGDGFDSVVEVQLCQTYDLSKDGQQIAQKPVVKVASRDRTSFDPPSPAYLRPDQARELIKALELALAHHHLNDLDARQGLR